VIGILRLPGFMFSKGCDMAQYLIYFNQQWVGDHPAEWYDSRGLLARALMQEMNDAGVLVFAEGLTERIENTVTADATSGTLTFIEGRYSETPEYLGGMTIVNVSSDEEARMWAGKIAEACGWPQEIRRFKE